MDYYYKFWVPQIILSSHLFGTDTELKNSVLAQFLIVHNL